MEHFPNQASVADVRGIVLSDQGTVRKRFLEALGPDVDSAIETATQAYAAYRHLERVTELNRRSAYVQAYVYSAFNSLVSSLNLFLAGMDLPAGNLMRHYGEASAMALLCSHEQIDVYQRIEKDPHKFPFHTALDLVNRKRNRKLLGVDGDAWKTFTSITGFYNMHSHPSVFALAAQTVFAQPGLHALIGEFDADRVPQYRIEIRRRTSAGEILSTLATHLANRLPPKPANPDSGSGAPAS